MKFLRNQLDKLAPKFEKGGKLERWYPLYEATDSFMYTPGHRSKAGAHVRDGIDMKRLMMTVVIALIPATLMAFYNTGFQQILATEGAGAEPSLLEAIFAGAWKFLPVYIVTLAIGGLIETVFAVVRKHEINEGFLVTSLLFPLILPPDIPLWQVGVGIAFGVLVGKEIFGGTGFNVLNPALTGRIFLFFAYPGQLSGDNVWVAGQDAWVDGVSGATALAQFYNGVSPEALTAPTGDTLTWMDYFIGLVPGSMGETSTLACLFGAVVLILAKVGSWRIMLSMFLGLMLTTLFLNAVAVNDYMRLPWHWHFVTGGFAFAMVFMATDPVSAASTNLGRWIYGFFIGMLTVIVRVLNPAYPEGVMLAIIFMNVFAPTIDYYVVKANVKRREQRLELQQ